MLLKNSFFSRCVRPSTVSASVGSIDKPIFEERVVNGRLRLVKTGKENLKEFIEASKEETLISNIIARFEHGDVNVLSRVQGFYGDVTGMPTNLQESQNLLIKLENGFNQLPIDVKRKFDNSFHKFLSDTSSMSSEDLMSAFGINSNRDPVVSHENIPDKEGVVNE